jgi:hypothetical protein
MLRRTIFLLILLLPAHSVWANSVIGPYTYDVAGTASIVGNPVCAGTPCVETVNFAFRFQWVETGETGLFQVNIIPGFTTITGSGPMGESAWRTVEGLFYSPYYFPMGNSSGELDLDMPNATFTETPWIGPTFIGSELYSCFTQACADAFVGSSQNPDGTGTPPFYGIFLGGTVQSTATALSDPVGQPIPEPASLWLLAAGLVGLALWQWKQRGRALT